MAAQWRKLQVIIFSKKCCPNAMRRLISMVGAPTAMLLPVSFSGFCGMVHRRQSTDHSQGLASAATCPWIAGFAGIAMLPGLKPSLGERVILGISNR